MECSKALSKLGFKSTGSYWYGYGPQYPIPSGCSIRDGGDKMPHLLKYAPGVGIGRIDLIPICRKIGIFSSEISNLCTSRIATIYHFNVSYLNIQQLIFLFQMSHIRSWIKNFAGIIMEVFLPYNQQRMLVRPIVNAKEFTTDIAMLRLVFIFAELPWICWIPVLVAAFFRKTKKVNMQNHFI